MRGMFLPPAVLYRAESARAGYSVLCYDLGFLTMEESGSSERRRKACRRDGEQISGGQCCPRAGAFLGTELAQRRTARTAQRTAERIPILQPAVLRVRILVQRSYVIGAILRMNRCQSVVLASSGVSRWQSCRSASKSCFRCCAIPRS